MRRNHLRLALAIFPAFLIISISAQAGELGNWVRPDGFASPNIGAGQYSFRAGLGISGWKYTWYKETTRSSSEGNWGGRTTQYHWRFISALTYGLTDRLVVLAAASYLPGQKYTDTGVSEYWNNDPYQSHFREDVKHLLSTNLTLAYKPRPTMEFLLSGTLSTSKFDQRTLHMETNPGVENGLEENLSYDVFAGINIAR
jgi:hypothetical protein